MPLQFPVRVLPPTRVVGEIADGLVLFYNMETLFGALMKDLSENGNHGTISGPVDIAGKVGRARQFDGIDDKINADDADGDLNILDAVTVAFWFNRAANVDNDVVVEKGPNDHYHFQTIDASGSPGGNRIFFGVGLSFASGRVITTVDVADGTWHHIAGTFDSTANRLQIYVDGILNKTNNAATDNPVSNLNPLKVGSRDGVAPFGGILDELRIYNRVLSAGEVSILSILGKSIRSATRVLPVGG